MNGSLQEVSTCTKHNTQKRERRLCPPAGFFFYCDLYIGSTWYILVLHTSNGHTRSCMSRPNINHRLYTQTLLLTVLFKLSRIDTYLIAVLKSICIVPEYYHSRGLRVRTERRTTVPVPCNGLGDSTWAVYCISLAPLFP